MIKEDYLIRKIKQIINTLLSPLTKNNDSNIIVIKENIDLKELIDNGNINEAENLLFNNIDYSKNEDFYISLMFYDYLNKKDDVFLKNNNFSRKEIEEGLFEICDLFGYTNFIDIFKDE